MRSVWKVATAYKKISTERSRGRKPAFFIVLKKRMLGK